MNVLVVVAHPDDETLGVGATMAKHVESGDTVAVLILGEGVVSRGARLKSEIAPLQENARRALKKLGVYDVTFLNFPDNNFDSVPLLKIVKEIEGKISEVKPAQIYTHHYSDLNVDHKLTYRAVLTAARPINQHVKKILCFEVPSSTRWDTEMDFQPNCYVDVSATLQKKLDALKEYGNEMREFPHARSLKYVEALAMVRGGDANLNAAEAFVIAREVM